MPGGGRGRAFNIRMAGDNTTVRPQIPRFAQDDTINLQEAERLGIKIVDRGSTCLVKVGEDPTHWSMRFTRTVRKADFSCRFALLLLCVLIRGCRCKVFLKISSLNEALAGFCLIRPFSSLVNKGVFWFNWCLWQKYVMCAEKGI